MRKRRYKWKCRVELKEGGETELPLIWERESERETDRKSADRFS